MDVKRQSASSGILPVDRHELRRRMEEILALRENVTSLEKVRHETRRRAITVGDPTSTGCKRRLAL